MGFVGCVRKDGFDLEKLYNAVSEEVAKENPDCETALKTINAAVVILMKEENKTTQDFKTRKNILAALKGIVLIRKGDEKKAKECLTVSIRFFDNLKKTNYALSDLEVSINSKTIVTLGVLEGKILVTR